MFHNPEDGDGDFKMTSWPTGFEKQSKIQVFANVPMCEEECERGWAEVVAFELNGVYINTCYNAQRPALTSHRRLRAAFHMGVTFGIQGNIFCRNITRNTAGLSVSS
jgi:hypothetical protein